MVQMNKSYLYIVRDIITLGLLCLSVQVQAQSVTAVESGKSLFSKGDLMGSYTQFMEALATTKLSSADRIQALYFLAKLEEDFNVGLSLTHVREAQTLLKSAVPSEQNSYLSLLLETKAKYLEAQATNISQTTSAIAASTGINRLVVKAQSALDDSAFPLCASYLRMAEKQAKTQSTALPFEFFLVKGRLAASKLEYGQALESFVAARKLTSKLELVSELDRLITDTKQLQTVASDVETADVLLKANNYEQAASAYYLIWAKTDKLEFGVLASKSYVLAGNLPKAIKVYEALEAKAPADQYIQIVTQKNSLKSIAKLESVAVDRTLLKKLSAFSQKQEWQAIENMATSILGDFLPLENSLPLLHHRIQARIALKALPLAVKDIIVYLLIDPYAKDLYVLRAKCYIDLGNFDHAILDVTRASEFEQDAEKKLQLLEWRRSLISKTSFFVSPVKEDIL